MKKIPILLASLAFLISLVAIYIVQSNAKLVYVDVNRLIEGYKRTKVIKAEYDTKVNKTKLQIDSLMTGWQQELQSYEKERAGMSPKDLLLKKEILSNKQQQINNYQESAEQHILNQDKKNTQTIINDINDYIKEFGSKHGYRIIFGASGTGNIMYANESSDLTEEVLSGLNESYDKK